MKVTRAVLTAIMAPLLALAGGCAKAPTVVEVRLEADNTVPMVLVLRSTVVRDSDPSAHATQPEIQSRASGGADADRPGPFQFPGSLPVSIPPGWSGPVTITFEGLDWDTNKVNATGTTSATAVSQQTTMATLKLTGVSIGGGGDGGADAGAANDAAGSSDAAAVD